MDGGATDAIKLRPADASRVILLLQRFPFELSPAGLESGLRFLALHILFVATVFWGSVCFRLFEISSLARGSF